MSKIIGIDLGTTNSVVAVMEGGDPMVISSAKGGDPPSVCSYQIKRRTTGRSNRKATSSREPGEHIYSVKRLMGRRIDLEETKRTKKMVSYDIVAGPQGDARVKVPVVNKTYSPQEISAMVLQKLKKDAEAYLG